MCTEDHSTTLFSINSTVTFNDNAVVLLNGGAAVATTSDVSFDINSQTIFNRNRCHQSGGALYFYNHTTLLVDGESTLWFVNNSASYGGAVYSEAFSGASFYGE